MSEQIDVKRIVEAILFNQKSPMTIADIQARVFSEEAVKKLEIEDAIQKLQSEYRLKSIELVELANGFTFRTKHKYAHWVTKLWQEKPTKYSRALLETLALIAYQQPITRGQIEEIRGVSVSSQTIRTLADRGWIKVVGHKEVPGRPALYGTEKAFLDYFGLKNLSDLPELQEPESIEIISKRLAENFEKETDQHNVENIK